MYRWLSIPVLALTAWAQQQASPDAAEAEKALRARVEQFYQLQVDKKYRQAEAFVAEDTKDWYYASAKSDLMGFSIVGIELSDGNTKANVRIKAKTTMMMMGAGRLPIEMPAVTTWKIENGAWVWYIDQNAAMQSPFGPVRKPDGAATSEHARLPSALPKIDLESLNAQVKLDKTSVILANATDAQTATVLNSLPGDIDLSVSPNELAGVAVELDKSHLASGEKATLSFRKTGTGKVSGTVHVLVSPLNSRLDVRVESR